VNGVDVQENHESGTEIGGKRSLSSVLIFRTDMNISGKRNLIFERCKILPGRMTKIEGRGILLRAPRGAPQTV